MIKDNYENSRKRWHNNYTNFINIELMGAYFEKHKFNSNNEYYRVDALAWKQFAEKAKETCRDVNMNPHLWGLSIAFEHENNYKDWYDEVIKLLYINAPLRVVVGYNRYGDRIDLNSPENDKNKLVALCKIIDCLDNKEELLHNGMLIIIGNCGKRQKDKKYELKEGMDFFGYRGYKLFVENNEVKFTNLKIDKNTKEN